VYGFRTHHYSTGMNGNRDYTMAGQGPLPPGNYALHPCESSPAGFFRRFIDRVIGVISVCHSILIREPIHMGGADSSFTAATNGTGPRDV
jgi:hypothetical protein